MRARWAGGYQGPHLLSRAPLYPQGQKGMSECPRHVGYSRARLRSDRTAEPNRLNGWFGPILRPGTLALKPPPRGAGGRIQRSSPTASQGRAHRGGTTSQRATPAVRPTPAPAFEALEPLGAGAAREDRQQVSCQDSAPARRRSGGARRARPATSGGPSSMHRWPRRVPRRALPG
jgi:hypothetical protein